MKPKLNPPGTKRLKVNFDILLSTSAFKFNLRRYSMDDFLFRAETLLHSHDFTGREVQIHPIKPTLKAPRTKHLKP